MSNFQGQPAFPSKRRQFSRVETQPFGRPTQIREVERRYVIRFLVIAVTIVLILALTNTKFQNPFSKVGQIKQASKLRNQATMQDFASRHGGGRVLPELTTQIPNSRRRNGPTAVIDDDLRPGRCWPFEGSQAQIGIQLSNPISITHVTIEHVSKALVDTVTTAPKTLMVWGFSTFPINNAEMSKGVQKTPTISHPQFSFVLIAELQYEIHGYNHRQTFPLKLSHQTLQFEGVVIEVLENWGGSSTCLYGVRVHGYKLDTYL